MALLPQELRRRRRMGSEGAQKPVEVLSFC